MREGKPGWRPSRRPFSFGLQFHTVHQGKFSSQSDTHIFYHSDFICISTTLDDVHSWVPLLTPHGPANNAMCEERLRAGTRTVASPASFAYLAEQVFVGARVLVAHR